MCATELCYVSLETHHRQKEDRVVACMLIG